jgi:hypothetical protein
LTFTLIQLAQGEEKLIKLEVPKVERNGKLILTQTFSFPALKEVFSRAKEEKIQTYMNIKRLTKKDGFFRFQGAAIINVPYQNSNTTSQSSNMTSSYPNNRVKYFRDISRENKSEVSSKPIMIIEALSVHHCDNNEERSQLMDDLNSDSFDEFVEYIAKNSTQLVYSACYGNDCNMIYNLIQPSQKLFSLLDLDPQKNKTKSFSEVISRPYIIKTSEGSKRNSKPIYFSLLDSYCSTIKDEQFKLSQISFDTELEENIL